MHYASRFTLHASFGVALLLKTLDAYIIGNSRPSDPLASRLWLFGRDRRFSALLATSVVLHVIFYATLIMLDSWAMRRVIADSKRPASLVKLIEVAPPPDRVPLRTAPESLERADISRLQFDPANADDVHLIQRSPKPAERRGTTVHLPTADVIERQTRSSRGSGSNERPGPANQRPTPPAPSSIQANRIGQLEEALITQTPPSPSAPVPPAPSPKADPRSLSPGTADPAQPGTRRGSNSEPSSLGLEAAQGQYMALVRAKISKVNERIMPREWIKDVLRDKVSADFSLIIKRDGQIQSSRLLRSSGYSVLDGYARQAIFTASPFEGFPQAAGNTLIFTVTVYFYTL
ncbi:MAG TPA: TonB C-terminal domain-containing protein [Blastocatellia bacterium]|nr:TonB C-terminal domain-containing protein [Blastocatellia bacterium]